MPKRLPEGIPRPAARRQMAQRCLIAADVDKTILANTGTERTEFLRRVASQLVEAAELGASLAFVTGNSMSHVTTSFLRWMLDHLCHTDGLELLEHFHFFCNSGGVYFHFPKGDPAIVSALSDRSPSQGGLSERIYDILTFKCPDGARLVYPRFVDPEYIQRTRIPTDEAQQIKEILEGCAEAYLSRIGRERGTLAKTYNLRKVSEGKRLLRPWVEGRIVRYGPESSPKEATVQLTLKPLLSFRFGRTKKDHAALFEKDLRTWVITQAQAALEARGLGHYVARPGGWSSIDVTLEKLDKAYALEFLIDHLNLQGHARQGQKFGSNAVYFGDEVIVGGGNDYPVTRIPGLLVLAVNSDRQLIPFLSHVFVPSSILDGPEATADVLAEFNKIARALRPCARNSRVRICRTSALDALKVSVFSGRIRDKLEGLRARGKASPEDWQMLHAFVTLMHREDPAGRRWLEVLVNELDSIMTQIAEHPRTSLPGIGASHPDH